MQIVDQLEPDVQAASAEHRAPALTLARRTSRVRAELALRERVAPQPLTRAHRRPQALAVGRGVAPVRPLDRSLRIVHLAAAHERLGAAPGRGPRLVR